MVYPPLVSVILSAIYVSVILIAIGTALWFLVVPQKGPGKKRDPAVRMVSLCFTDRTLYGVDDRGRVWFIDMRDGSWALAGNPIEPEVKK
jgi:hypothetical protein